jgi:hypothetical protein
MQAQYLLRENIKALLRSRQEDASALSGWLGHDKSWINKILNGHRDMQIGDFDRVADFFGIATYQLLQPGISRLTERRQNSDRRVGRDRRIGHSHRAMLETAAELDRVRPSVATKGRDANAAAVIDPIHRVIEQAAREIQRLSASMEDARRQTAVVGGKAARVRPRDRAVGRSADSASPPAKVK